MQHTSLTLPLIRSGKVRQLFELSDDRILMVATDNISAFDRVLPTPIPDKGAVLTQLSTWWSNQLTDLIPNQLRDGEIPDEVAGRAVVVEQLEMVPVECVARGYLAGSAWQEYQETGRVAGVEMPAGLLRGQRLPRPVFTPASKAPDGEHDENITYEQLARLLGDDMAAQLRLITLKLYVRAERIARSRGLLVVDTKFEFGLNEAGDLVLADEVLTPDSSRFWELSSYVPGADMEALDKQYLRDWIVNDSGWDPDSSQPAPELPDDVVEAVATRYRETFKRLTGGDVVPAPPMPEPPPVEEVPVEVPVAQAAAVVAAAAPQEVYVEQQVVEPGYDGPTVSFVVDVMPKPEILDPQGKAVTGALHRLGFTNMSVRQGKRFELTVPGEMSAQLLEQVREAAEKLLANTVIEDFEVYLVEEEEVDIELSDGLV